MRYCKAIMLMVKWTQIQQSASIIYGTGIKSYSKIDFRIFPIMKQRQSENIFYQIIRVLSPLAVYYIVYCAAFLILATACDAVVSRLGIRMQTAVAAHAETLTELMSGLAMLIGALPLLPSLRTELAAARHDFDSQRHAAGSIVCTLVLAATSAVGLNALLALTGFVQISAVYQEVARQQYSVVFGVGAVLFGLFSPVAEEIVFRGLIFNRLRKYCGAAAAVIVSGVLFGVYHGNLVQGVYGGCMGMLMAYVYLRARSFFYPCLFHAAANLAVFALAQNAALHARFFTVPGCALLLAAAAACVLLLEKRENAQKK